jgi:multidrug efflux system membrane fusion protein
MLPGCNHAPPPGPASTLPVVPVSRPVEREVTDYVDYTGRTAAVQALDVRARVTGYLMQMPFKEGGDVKKGDLLFEIDPRPYQDMVDAAKAQVAVAEANLRLARVTYQRDQVIAARDPGGVSKQQLDQDLAQQQQAQANLGVARANLKSAELNLEWTRVTSPIDGMVSRFYYTLGNLVVQDQTLLTTIVSVDPMYAYFDADENTIIRVRTYINEGKIKAPPNSDAIPLLMAVGAEEGFPHQGHISFVNNTVNPSTGTLAVRGTFANPKPPNGRRILSPGMFVRIRVPIGQAHPALLVADRAIGSDQGLKFVYVVDAEHKVQYRRVRTGALQEDGLRVVEGLNKDDWVVVGALQQVRPGMEIEPEEMAMPAFGNPAGQAPPPVPDKPQPPPAGR